MRKDAQDGVEGVATQLGRTIVIARPNAIEIASA
jgi:hypothetical protein